MLLSHSQLQQINLHTSRFVLDLFLGPFKCKISVILLLFSEEREYPPESAWVMNQGYFSH